MTAGPVRLRCLLVALAAAVATLTACVPHGRPPHPPGTVGAFTRELAIPPLADAHRHGSRVSFDLRLRSGTSDFGRGKLTRTWGINGDYLGPTLRARRGDQVTVHVTNGLDEPTTMHWHGMHLPARMDGGPHQPIDPGAIWSPGWTVNQPAATLWYHPHPDGHTAHQVYRGLAGMFILDDPASDALRLPHRYGVDDIPLIVQDKLFAADGQLSEHPRGISNTGLLGDTILVNGTPSAYLTVTTAQVRLRLLNASNARIYDFGFADDRPFALVGTDGGLLGEPVALHRIQLAPGERAEIVATLRPGERTVLRSFRPQLGGGFLADRLAGGDDTFDVLQLRAARRLVPAQGLPTRLATVAPLPAGSAVRRRTFDLEEDRINGRHMDMDRVDQVVELDTPEVWSVTNHSGSPHTFHVHGTQFQILDPAPSQRGWKDTVYIPPGRHVDLVIRFADYADPQWPYMFHCHMLRHEDAGMMGQFLVVRPGQQPSSAPAMPGMPMPGPTH